MHRPDPPAASGCESLFTARERPTVRPRFTVEDIRILLAAMHVYRDREDSFDVRELYDRIDALSTELEEKWKV